MASMLKKSSRVQLEVLNPGDEELNQSAAILFRELKAHGLAASLVSRAQSASAFAPSFDAGRSAEISDETQAEITIVLSSEQLISGEVKFHLAHQKETFNIKLEEAVDRAVELVNAGRAN